MTTNDYIEFVCEQLNGIGIIRYRKMFGEYMVYLNEKPVIIVCDNVAYVKKLDCIKEMMIHAKVGTPYNGAKEHYILDVDDLSLCKSIVIEVEKHTSIPKKRNKKN